MTAERVRVGDVLALQRRDVLIQPEELYTLVGVYSFGKGIFHREPRSGSDVGDYRFFSVVPGDLVLSNIQAWEGAIGYATEQDRGAIGTHRFLSYVARDGRIDTNWARWFFLSEPGMDLIRMAAPGTTIRNRTLAIERFEALAIPLPPIDEQRRVARQLDAAADAANVVADLTRRAKELSEALVVSLATRPDLSKDEKRRTGWRFVHFGDIAVLNKDEVAVDANASYDIAGVYSFGRGLLRRGPIEGSQTSYRTFNRLHTGQVVMSRLKAWEGAITVVPKSFAGWFVSPEFPTFNVDQTCVRPRFLEAVLTGESFWSGLKGASHGIGARRERVGADRLLEQQLWLPPVGYQDQAIMRFEVLDACSVQRGRSATRAAALGPASLNEAFSGLT